MFSSVECTLSLSLLIFHKHLSFLHNSCVFVVSKLQPAWLSQTERKVLIDKLRKRWISARKRLVDLLAGESLLLYLYVDDIVNFLKCLDTYFAYATTFAYLFRYLVFFIYIIIIVFVAVNVF